MGGLVCGCSLTMVSAIVGVRERARACASVRERVRACAGLREHDLAGWGKAGVDGLHIGCGKVGSVYSQLVYRPTEMIPGLHHVKQPCEISGWIVCVLGRVCLHVSLCDCVVYLCVC